MDRRHLKCWLWKLLWVLAIASLVVAWVGIKGDKVILGLNSLGWFWNALVMAVLAISVKLDCHTCAVCKIGSAPTENQ